MAPEQTEQILTKLDDLKTHVDGKVTRVHERIDTLATTTGEFKLEVVKALTEVSTVQKNCPVNTMDERLRTVETSTTEALNATRRWGAVALRVIGAVAAAAILGGLAFSIGKGMTG